MAAEADARCGAAYGQRSPERVNARNGYGERAFDTRAGTIALAIPKLRQGSDFPHWLLEPRRRAEQALTQVGVPVLRGGRLHPPGGRHRQGHGHRGHLQVPGLGHGRHPRRHRGGVSAPGRWTPVPTPTCGWTG